MPTRPHLNDVAAFEPEVIEAMSTALDEACRALHLNGQVYDRQVVAARIIDLACRGVIDAQTLSNRVLEQTNSQELAVAPSEATLG